MLVFENESAAINNAVYEVHKRLGVGLQESLYQEALAIELDYQCIPFEREKRYNVYYRGQRLDHYYFADFVCYNKIILEVIAVSQLTDQHKAQVRNYIGIAEKRKHAETIHTVSAPFSISALLRNHSFTHRTECP